MPETDAIAFQSSSLSSCTLHVPSASVDFYRAADGWKEFYNIIPLTDSELVIRNPSCLSDIDAPIYDLSGRQLRYMQKSINIIGGKKVMKY